MVSFGSWIVLPVGLTTVLLLLETLLKMSVGQVLLHIEVQMDIMKMEMEKL